MLVRRDRHEGPFGEFVGYLSPADPAPVLEVTALTHRSKPIYHAINGYGRETVMLRKYVLEASLLKVLQAAVPIVTDAEMTAGGLHRFHAVVQVKKTAPKHEGLQRNAILAAFAALKDLDLVIVVDDDIDIRDPVDVEYALATRMEASRDLFTVPGARGHEYVRVGRRHPHQARHRRHRAIRREGALRPLHIQAGRDRPQGNDHRRRGGAEKVGFVIPLSSPAPIKSGVNSGGRSSRQPISP